MRSPLFSSLSVLQSSHAPSRLRSRSVLFCTAAAVSAAMLLTTGCSRNPNVRKKKYLESGKKYEGQGKLREAGIQFSNALKIDRNYADAHFELGKLYLKMSSYQVGYQEMRRTIDLDPSNLTARIDVANILLAAKRPDDAEQQAKAILAINPNNADGHSILANVYGERGDIPAERKELEQALAIEPNRSIFHVQLALLDGRTAPSDPVVQQELQKAVTLDSSNVQAHLILASSMERQGNLGGAVEQVKAAEKAAPTDLQIRRVLTGLYLKQGDKADAEATLRQTAEDFSEQQDGASLLSEYYVQTGQGQQGDNVYADLVNKHPKSVPLKVAYARLLASTQQMDKFNKLVTELVKSNPKDPEVQLLNAGQLIAANKVNEAFDAMQKAISNAPDNVKLQIAMGRVAVRKGDWNTAGKSFDEAARLAPTNLDGLSGEIEVAQHNNDDGRVLQVANKAISLDPNLEQAYVWRGGAEADQKDFANADKDFHTALSKNPNNATALTAMGQLEVLQKHVPEGVASLEKALTINPNDIAAMRLLVLLDLQDKHPEKATARLNEQIGRSPRNPELYNMLALLDLSTRDFNGTVSAAQKALQLAPGDVAAVQAETQGQAALGNLDGAIATWQGWLNAHPTDAAAMILQAALVAQKGEKPKAMDLYRKALLLKPDDPMASNNLAYLMVDTGGNLDEALTLAQNARRALPNSGSTADTLAWVYFHKGRYASARDLLEDSLRNNPNDPDAEYHLGMTYEQLNDKANATTHLKKAVALGKDSPIGKQASDALAKAG